jgi:hypothetical protein
MEMHRPIFSLPASGEDEKKNNFKINARETVNEAVNGCSDGQS